MSIVEGDDELVAEIRESDMRGGHGTTRYPVKPEGERVFITLPYEGRFPVLLDVAVERYERIADTEAEEAFEKFEAANDALAANKARCKELQSELSARASERVEGDEEAWNAYLEEVANAKPRAAS